MRLVPLPDPNDFRNSRLLSEIHLRNMLALRRAGAIIMPASPGFYSRPHDLVELVDSLVQRVLDHLGVEARVFRRWRERAAGGSAAEAGTEDRAPDA